MWVGVAISQPNCGEITSFFAAQLTKNSAHAGPPWATPCWAAADHRTATCSCSIQLVNSIHQCHFSLSFAPLVALTAPFEPSMQLV